MATANASPEKQSFVLVTFVHGDPAALVYERYTNCNRDLTGFVGTPQMSVDIPDNSGGFDDKAARVILPVDTFTDSCSQSLPFSAVYLQIEEITTGAFAGDAGSRKTLFRGRCSESIRNYQGRKNVVAFFALPIKARVDVAMGLQCNHHCSNRLFGPGCGLIKLSHRKFGQIATMDGKEVTISASVAITNPTAPGGDNSRFWERGYLQKDGIQIPIHIWSIATPDLFVLRRRPPSDWLLAGATSIEFVPGCHKTIEDCRAVWDNEQGHAGSGGFAGYGYAMLPYNPMFESPQ